MRNIYSSFKNLYLQQVPAHGLAVFRILYGTVLLCEILQLLYFKHLIFDPVPFLDTSEVDFTPVLLVWAIAIIFLILGLFTRYVTIINYVLTLLTFSTFKDFEYHLDWSLIGVNFLLMFIPLSMTFSVDRLVEKLKYSTLRTEYKPPSSTSIINYYLPVLIGIGLVYFDSIFWKLASPMWLNGLGFWLPTSLPFNTYLDLTPILNLKYLSLLLGYITLLFELVFLFLIWFKKFRIPLVVIGIGLHVGILLAYPIPWFALGITSIYTLLIFPEFWRNYLLKIKSNTPSLFVYYDEECPLCNRTKIIVKHFDIFNKIAFKGIQTFAHQEPKLHHLNYDIIIANIHSLNRKGNVYKGVETYIQIFKRIWFLWPISVLLRVPPFKQISAAFYNNVAKNRYREVCNEENCSIKFPLFPVNYNDTNILANVKVFDLKVVFAFLFITYCFISQSFLILKAPVLSKLFTAFGFERSNLKIANLFTPINRINADILGLENHAVFIDWHFHHYNHIVTIIYNDPNGDKVWLPIMRKNGQVGYMNTGKQWAKWTWRVNEPNISTERMSDGIKDYTSFWAHKKGINLDSAVFTIVVKKIEIPKKWEQDFLRTQMNQPWVEAGKAWWINEKFHADIKNIEAI